jgi:uncharacterized phage protein (TIGR01671 family)
MREILFRGRSLEDGEWKYGYLSQYIDVNDRTITQISPIYHECRSEYSPLPPIYDVDEQTVGQYIGVKDCNGRRIFEGDITESEHGYRHLVVFGSAVLKSIRYCALINHIMDMNNLPHNIKGLGITKFKRSIIGNIYDNPELLKGGKQ